jgi:peptidyl-prolyl cis-trans isomerase D
VFDFVNRKKRVVQVIMLLAVLPFLFFGLESYRRDSGEGTVAVVDGDEIQRREFEQALRDQQERMRGMLGENFDSAILDNPEVRFSVLESLIQQRLLRKEALNIGMTVLDSQLVRAIGDIPEFQQDGQFSTQRYEDLLRAQGISPLNFESRVKEELMLQQLLDAYSENGFVSNTVAKKIMYLSEVQREINLFQIEPEQFLSQVEPDDAAIESYYDTHQNEFLLPERVRVEYLVLSLEEVAAQQAVTDNEIAEYFDEHQNEFGQPEERQASHILFAVPATASDEEKETIRSNAEDVLDQLRQDPGKFAEFAAQHSDDPGSAPQGGDLGFFGRGVMVKEFEDEIFQMEPEEIRGLVETNFGFHIIQLSAIKAAEAADFSEVKEQIAHNLRMQKAETVFGDIAEDFSNIVYEQSDTLQTAAQQFGLSIQQSDWIDRESNEPTILAHDRLFEEIFSDDVIVDKHNTPAIEVTPDTLVSARVLEHRSPSMQSLTIVKDEIVERLKVQMAVEMALEKGEKKLAQLQEGAELEISWGEPKQVSYIESQGIDSSVMQAIFKKELTEIPAFTGIGNPQGGFTLIRINHVIEPDMAALIEDESKYRSFSKQLQQMLTQEETASYLTGLRQRYDVSIRQGQEDF